MGLGTDIFRKRDIAFLIIIVITTYICFDSNNFSYVFEPAWYLDQRNGLNKDSKVVPPIITDLNGDGIKEIIMVTSNSKFLELKIFTANQSPSNDGKGIYTPTEMASYNLLQDSKDKVKYPIAMNTGYVTRYDNKQGRKQVIVVLRDDLSLLCFDSNLKLLWEKQLAHKLHDVPGLLEHYNAEDVYIRVLPLMIKDGHSGTVIVGVSMKPKELYSETRIRLESGMMDQETHTANRFGNISSTEDINMNIQAKLQHFNMYALDAVNSTMIWRHDGVDVKPEQYVRTLPQHAFKLHLGSDITNKLHMSHSHGMNDWTAFRQSLFAELPHLWRDSYDTNIRIAHFVRRHLGAGSQNQLSKPRNKDQRTFAVMEPSISSINIKSKHASSSSGSSSSRHGNDKKGSNVLGDLGRRFTGIETPPLSHSASLPHDALEHAENPNVLVAHTSQGLEVISLTTGTPITALSLYKDHAYADLDGDGTIDTVSVLENSQDVAQHSITMIHDNENLQHCMVVVTSGLPPQSQLFNGSVCQGRRHLHDPIHKRFSNIPLAIKSAPPIIFKHFDPKTLKESSKKDLAIAINTGVFTCYNGDGDFLWQIDNTPSWPLDFQYYYAGLYDTNAKLVDESGVIDSNLQANFIVIGDKYFSLISREGHLLTVTDLPAPPKAKPVIGDFNNDGLTDLILVTNDAILGYRLEAIESTNLMLIGVGLLFLIACFSFFMNIRTFSDGDEDDDYDDSGSGSGRGSRTTTYLQVPKSKRSIMALIRSTDEQHID